MDRARTIPESESSELSPTTEPTLALCLAHCAEEPWRAGEVAFVPPAADRAHGARRVLGRGPPHDAASHPPLTFARVRGDDHDPQPPLANRRISRAQLVVASLGGKLAIENVGRLRMDANGVPADDAVVDEGDVISLGAQLVLLVVRRAPVARTVEAPFAFGNADPHGIVGESAAAWALRDAIAFVRSRSAHVLVTGPSGSGKELVARAIHRSSARRDRPLVARNAATIPETLIDAELFGNARNYPNPGMPEREGMIGSADGGSLFLDEIAELPVAMQAHLLRVLDAGEYVRLGESRARRADLRVIGATNRPLSAFKHDLLARFVLRVRVPGLNERREDIPLLLRHRLRAIAADDAEVERRFGAPMNGRLELRVAPRMIRALLRRTYSTHARELEAIVWRAIAASREDTLDLAPEDDDASCGTLDRDGDGDADGSTMQTTAEDDALSPARIQAALDANNGVVESTWRALGLSSRHALARLIRRHRLEIRRRTG